MTQKTEYSKFIADESRHMIYEQESLAFEATELISRLMEADGVSKADLAKRIGKSKAHITQMLSGARNMTMHSFAQLAFALGYKVAFSCKPLVGTVIQQTTAREIGAVVWEVCQGGARLTAYFIPPKPRAVPPLPEVTSNSWVA